MCLDPRFIRKGSGPHSSSPGSLPRRSNHGLGDIAAAAWRTASPLQLHFPGNRRDAPSRRGYSIEDLSGNWAAVLARERAHVPTSAASRSGGSLSAAFAANTNPKLVEPLVLIDTTPRYVRLTARQMWGSAARARAQGGPSPVVDRRPI